MMWRAVPSRGLKIHDGIAMIFKEQNPGTNWADVGTEDARDCDSSERKKRRL